LGYRYRGSDCILSRLGRFLGEIGAADINADSYEAWCRSIAKNHPNSRRKAQQFVRRFCIFRARTEPGFFVPSVYSQTKLQPYVRPVIVEPDQVVRMLAVADTLPDRNSPPLRAAANRIAVVLLYTTGLRLGELLRLAVPDIEDSGRVLRIRDSKFHRSRLLPLSRSAQHELRAYLQARAAAFPTQQSRGSLLCHGKGGKMHGYSPCGFSALMKALFRLADVHDCEGRRPRIHDMRHSFAIQSVIRLYRAEGDVQSALPKIALYMGHVSIESTLHYVRLVPQLAALASRRFERHFGHWVQGGVS
jgi:integrase